MKDFYEPLLKESGLPRERFDAMMALAEIEAGIEGLPVDQQNIRIELKFRELLYGNT